MLWDRAVGAGIFLLGAIVIVGAALEVSAWLRRRRQKREDRRCFDAELCALLDDPDGYTPAHSHQVASPPRSRPQVMWSALRRRSGGGR